MMDYTLDKTERKFARQVKQQLEEWRHPDWIRLDRESPQYREVGRRMDRRLVEAGWWTMHWPPEYGGSDSGAIKQGILRELEGYFRVPTRGGHGRYIVGPALMQFGTEEQKRRYLPAIATAEVVLALGYTEPGAGSDLAAMVTSGLRRPGGWVVNGTKTFITYGHYADAILLAARTDPDSRRHQGVSLFVVPLDLPGIEIRPLICMTGHRVNEISFSDVEIDDNCLVGHEGNGFKQMANALNFERSGVSRPAWYLADLEMLRAEAIARGRWGAPELRAEAGWLKSTLAAWRLACWRVIYMQAVGGNPSWQASVSEYFRKRVNPRFGQLIADVIGLEDLLYGWESEASFYWRWRYRESFNNHGQGGRHVTSNAIARRGLRLPRLGDTARTTSKNGDGVAAVPSTNA